jgi:hypothetical protein
VVIIKHEDRFRLLHFREIVGRRGAILLLAPSGVA